MDKPESEIEIAKAFIDAVEASLGDLVPKDLYALARRGAEMQWRPIETAPKEGGPILLFEPPGDEDQIGVGYYEPVTDHEGTEWLTFWETGVRCDATHWMPLPPPPALKDAK